MPVNPPRVAVLATPWSRPYGGPIALPGTLSQKEVKSGNNNIWVTIGGQRLGWVHTYGPQTTYNTTDDWIEYWVLKDMAAFVQNIDQHSADYYIEWAGGGLTSWLVQRQAHRNAMPVGEQWQFFKVTYQYQSVSSFNGGGSTGPSFKIFDAGVEVGRMGHRLVNGNRVEHWVLRPDYDILQTGDPINLVSVTGAVGAFDLNWVKAGAPSNSDYVTVTWSAIQNI
ncbi:MAG: hypothetical protein D6798_08475 [Deltaproteobacteria bacterium]|nr:MAG: hypothetical protein D6798_08475 [Deltaproteobacteria bacterium]